MGHRHSRHHVEHIHHVVIKPDPEIERKAKEAERQANEMKARAEASRRAEASKPLPVLIKEKVEAHIETVKKMDLKSSIVKKAGERHVGIIGPVSSGKTTLLNVMFGLSRKVAMGHCTNECERVYDANNLVLWDTHGDDTSFRFFSPDQMSFIKGLDRCIVMFNSDIKSIENLIKIVYAVNPSALMIVRTKVDECEGSSAKTIKEEQFSDGEKVKDVFKLGKHFDTYCISSHNVRNGKETYDWAHLKKSIMSP
jgi:hypothetical protein